MIQLTRINGNLKNIKSEFFISDLQVWYCVPFVVLLTFEPIVLNNFGFFFWLTANIYFTVKEQKLLALQASKLNLFLCFAPLILYVINVISISKCDLAECRELYFRFLERHLLLLLYPILLFFARTLSDIQARIVLNWFSLFLIVQLIPIIFISNYDAVHYPYLGMFAAFAFAFCFTLYVSDKSRIHLVATILLMLLLLVIKAKIAIFSTFVLSLVILIPIINKKMFFWITSIAAILFFSLWHLSLWSSLNDYIGSIFYIKTFSWKCSWQAFLESRNFWFGVGIGNSERALTKVYHTFPDWVGYMGYNSHNQFLETLLAQGVIGLLLLLVWLGLLFKRAIIENNKLLLYLVLVFTIASLTESVLWRQKGIFFLVFFSIFLLKKINSHGNE